MAHVFLLTGLSGAGKTTLAEGLLKRLGGSSQFVLLDGDAMRRGICSDLCFTPKDRAENIRRCGEMAKLLADQGISSILAVIAPYEDLRASLARIIGDKLRIIHVSCPLEVCINRDPKKNYQRALAGQMQNYTGIADAYEIPKEPHLVIETHRHDIEACLDRLEQFVLGAKEQGNGGQAAAN